MIAALLASIYDDEDGNYPWPDKFPKGKLHNLIIQEDTEILELIAIILASETMEC